MGGQYDSYEQVPGLKVNGKLTMGENIGDLGGLQMAYAAYKLHVAKHGEPPVLNGFTGDAKIYLDSSNPVAEPYLQAGLGLYLLDSTYFGTQSVGTGSGPEDSNPGSAYVPDPVRIPIFNAASAKRGIVVRLRSN